MHNASNTPARLLALALVLAACSDDDDPGISTGDETTAAETTTSTSEASATDPTETVPPGCGDGVVDADEGCDDGPDNGADKPCTPECEPAACGDGYVGPGEGCDDGNDIDGDECNNMCALPSCGDAVKSPDEACDDGDQDNSDGCLATCELASCGDDYVHAGVELCDDGNLDNSDGCLSSCVPAKCGDGYVRQGQEDCDDGNDVNSDACLDTCVLNVCGDGYVHEGVEACDDANDDDTDACLNDCSKPATCDDQTQNGGESDVDCGGPTCAGCLDDELCGVGPDCASGFCHDGLCVTPRHCRDLRDLDLASEDGEYIVDPDGQNTGAEPISVYCEMSFNGGGWTAVFNMREKPIGESAAQQMFDAVSANGPIVPVLPNSNSPAILTQGLLLSQFTEVVFGWAPTLLGDVTRYARHVDAMGLQGKCYLDGFCGKGVDVGEFDIVPTGNTRTLQTGKAAEWPHVGLGFDDQIVVWGYDRNASHFSNWANLYDEGPCCKAGNTTQIGTPGWRYVIYVR